jgi:beta-lactamase regulating signal transducer with metallopeptidase domain
MNMVEMLPDPLTERLALMLLHFIWQGAAVAVVFGVAGAILGLQGPSGRYALNLLAFLAMAGCPPATFYALSQSSITATVAAAKTADSVVARPAGEVDLTSQGMRAGAPPFLLSDDPKTVWEHWLRISHRWIVLGWMMGAGLLGVRLLLGWAWLQALKRGFEPVPKAVLRQAEILCQALHIRAPGIYSCRCISEAIATGLVRPAILFPLAWLSELPADMVEAVLAHELAHLRRFDLWVNVVQRLVEALLFYHPAVWWLSRKVRIERELCCDEIAVGLTKDRLRYAETLQRVGLLVSHEDSPDLALAIAGRRMTLLMRVKHALSPKPRARSNMAWLTGALPVLLTIAIWRCTFYAPAPVLAAEENKNETVTGTVVDPENRPLANQAIHVYKYGLHIQDLRTDDKGQFKMPIVWRAHENERYALLVRAKDRLGWLDFSNPQPETATLRIVLLPLTQNVTGELTDGEGEPLAGIPVVVDSIYDKNNAWLFGQDVDEALITPAVTDRAGRFAIKLPPDTRSVLKPRHPDWTSNAILVREESNLGRVKLAPSGRIEGYALDVRTGKAMAGVSVGVQAFDQRLKTGWGQTTSDASGRFVIGGLLPGQYNVLFLGMPNEPKLTAPAVEAVTVEFGKAARVVLPVAKGRLLAGKVVDGATGKPLAKCYVGCYGSARPRSGAACLGVRTDAQGEFSLYVPAGVSYVYVSDGRRQSIPDSSRTIEVSPGRDPEPVLLKAGPPQRLLAVPLRPEDAKAREQNPSYRLRWFMRAVDGRPVTKVELRLVFQGKKRTSQREQHAGNSFVSRFDPSDDGRKAFYLIDAEGFAPTRSPEFVIQNTMPAITIDLQPETRVRVRGRVLDGQGNPVAGVRVRSGRMIYEQEDDFPWGVEATTDQSGRFLLKHARVGDRLYVRVDKEGAGSAQSEIISITSPDPIDLQDLHLGE